MYRFAKQDGYNTPGTIKHYFPTFVICWGNKTEIDLKDRSHAKSRFHIPTCINT